jgi:Uma2 family endonuclease
MTVAQPADLVQPALADELPGHWPRDIVEAYARYPGPYTVENAETLLEEEPVELYNGWLVWQEMTDTRERRVVATLQAMLDLSARKTGFGQVLPDQLECLLSDGSVVKPDASLISWTRLQQQVHPHGPRQRPTLMGGPELVVEVRSPSNRRAQERFKRQLYFANNVEIVWDVDDVRQRIWVYRATAPTAPTEYGIADVIDCTPFLPGWRRRVADIFAEQASAETVAGEVAEAWRAEGHAAGVASTLREMLPLLARVRFGGALPPDLPARLASSTLEDLQRLQATIETCSSLEEWLQG